MENIAVIRLMDDQYDKDDNLIYYIRKDEQFEAKMEKFKKVLKTHENFQEIEDFIFDNFEHITLDTYKLYF